MNTLKWIIIGIIVAYLIRLFYKYVIGKDYDKEFEISLKLRNAIEEKRGLEFIKHIVDENLPESEQIIRDMYADEKIKSNLDKELLKLLEILLEYIETRKKIENR